MTFTAAKLRLPPLSCPGTFRHSRVPVILLLLAGCQPASDGPVVDADCPVDQDLFASLAPRLAPVETVVVAAWETTEAVEARVLYVDTNDPDSTLSTPWSTSGTAGLINLLGLRPNRTIELQIEARGAGDATDSERRCSPSATLPTGSLPSALPETVVTTLDEGRDVLGWHTVAVIRSDDSLATIVDAEGQFVWATEVASPVFRATLSVDGTAMLSNQPADLWTGTGTLWRTPLGEGDVTRIDVVGSHTDFVELPDGTLATLGWTNRLYADDTRNLLGDTIIEVSPDGTQTIVWDIFDHFVPSLSGQYAPSPAAVGDEQPQLEEWSHVNSISYDAASDDYLVTGSFNHSVMRIDRGTGDMVWTLTDGGGATDWQVNSEERELELPHSAQLIDDHTVLAFSRGPVGSEADPAACAWVTELALDDSTGAANPLLHYSSNDCVTVPFLGEARRIDGGNTTITWSPAGRISQIDADLSVVFQVDLDLGAAFGFGEWSADLYRSDDL